MRKCGKEVKEAMNGASRGFCIFPAGHAGRHSSKTCFSCGIALTAKNASLTGLKTNECRRCTTEQKRKRCGHKPINLQIPGKFHVLPCGCSGIVPTRDSPNKFAVGNSNGCRVNQILLQSFHAAKKHGYAPISQKTPHFVIRELMNKEFCWLCKEPMKWVFGRGKTPHLHHDHVSGEIYGFTHVRCNTLALERVVFELRKHNHELEQRVRELEAPAAIAA